MKLNEACEKEIRREELKENIGDYNWTDVYSVFEDIIAMFNMDSYKIEKVIDTIYDLGKDNEAIKTAYKKWHEWSEDEKESLQEAKDKSEKYYVGYTTEENEDKVFKVLTDLKKIRDLVKDLLQNKDKLDSLSATALYVNSINDDEEIFVAIKDEDTEEWEIEADNFEEYQQKSLPDEYKNTLLNRVYYSLTGAIPDNLKTKSPVLYNNLVRAEKGSYAQDGDEAGYHFNDNGDAVIKLQIDRASQDEIAKVINHIKKVSDNFNLNLQEKGDNKFIIVIKDQAKLYTDVRG